ncbi:hypothetical protein [Salipaludibacillus keqinensis]|uniref:hypothetical protein n=1 Tax=Salipaludibacillus keqinensis TaxID=2045207 RepID=UPI001304EEEE|nr:hypothetical protein [Salipaludibacillus keqinensis]
MPTMIFFHTSERESTLTTADPKPDTERSMDYRAFQTGYSAIQTGYSPPQTEYKTV